MNYLNPTLSKMLSDLGVKNTSGKSYFALFGSDLEILDDEDVIDTTDPTDDVVFAGVKEIRVEDIPLNHDVYDRVPAYVLELLICDAEAMKLVFPEIKYKESELNGFQPWSVEAHELLDLLLNGKPKQAISLLTEAVTRRLECHENN